MSKVYYPNMGDIETAYRRRCRPDDVVHIDQLIAWVAEDLEGHLLPNDWQTLLVNILDSHVCKGSL